jgi:hypothetical protein
LTKNAVKEFHLKEESDFLENQPVERTMLRIRIRQIHVFLGLLDPDILFIGMGASDPDTIPYIVKQK